MQTLNQFDEAIIRPHGAGTSARVGGKKFIVAEGARRDRESVVVSIHRTSRGAARFATEGRHVWQWDAWMAPAGGYRPI